MTDTVRVVSFVLPLFLVPSIIIIFGRIKQSGSSENIVSKGIRSHAPDFIRPASVISRPRPSERVFYTWSIQERSKYKIVYK